MKRPLGQGETLGARPPARDDMNGWSFRGQGLDNTELTTEPIRISHQVPAPAKLVELEYDVVVVGGAAGGLSAAGALKRRGVERVLVVEKNEKPGDIWLSRYHR